jgi:hypothetical protein
MTSKQDFPDTSFLTTLPKSPERIGPTDQRLLFQILPSGREIGLELLVSLARAPGGQQELSE